MVKGLDVFRAHFRAHTDQYALIGGAACVLAMEDAGLEFRATKDLDIVLCVETLDRSFVAAFWDFVRLGEYRLQEKATGEKRYYRFQKPATPGFPFMLELFSRVPDSLSPVEGSRLTPIPVTEDVSRLSAILLDDAYYHFLHSGRKEKDGLAFVRPEHLIPLKARAWIDLTKRKAQGDPVDGNDIRKHQNDVFRLYAIIDPSFHADIPAAIRDDMDTFVAAMANTHIDPQAFGLRNTEQREILDRLRRIYGLR